MAVIALRSFAGEIPKLAPHLLPENAAQLSTNVDHAHGYLKPMNDGLALKTVGVNGWTAGGALVYSMFTLDGIAWYTSPQAGTEWFRSPVIDESYNRTYWLLNTRLGVSEWDITQTMGGLPSVTYAVGVPTPTVAPVCTLIDLTTLPDYPSATFTFSHWYEKDLTRFQEGSMSVTTITALKTFQFTPVSKITGEDSTATPTDAVLVAQIEVKDGTTLLFRASTAFGSTVPSRTQALPGGIELTLTKVTETTYNINLSWGVVETRAYVYTYVNGYQEESGPSPATLISPTYIQNVQIVTNTLDFTGFKGYSDTNIYRTFGGNAAFLKIAKTGSVVTWMDNSHKANNVGTGLVTTGWQPPPIVLHGLKLMPQGWFAAFTGNTLWMSEPYHPHTWPYAISFPYGIRGICPGAQGLVVTTYDETYMVMGAHPASVMPIKLPIPIGGVSQLGMCNVEGMVAYLSHDGIVLVDGSSASLGFSEKLFTRSDWRTRYGVILSGMKLSYHDGFLVATSPNADPTTGDYGFIVRIDEAMGMFSRFNKPIYGAQRIPINDTLYYSTTSTGGSGGYNILEFNGGSALTATWWSKDFIFPDFMKFGAYQIRASGSVTVTVYVDDVQVYSQAVTSGVYRLPAGFGQRWSVKFETSANLYEFIMAQTMGELSNA